MPRAATAAKPATRSTRAIKAKMAANDPKVKIVRTIGLVIDEMATNRDKKRLLEADIKTLEEGWNGLEQELIDMLDTQQLTLGRGSAFTASIQEKTNYTVAPENWESTVAWAVKNKRTDMLYRRVSNPSVAELLSLGKTVPGVEGFPKRVISLRKL